LAGRVQVELAGRAAEPIHIAPALVTVWRGHLLLRDIRRRVHRRCGLLGLLAADQEREHGR